MTGYGRGEVASGSRHVTVELRSVNNRFLEIAIRLPRSLSLRENDCKDLIRKTINRGKINVTVTLDRGTDAGTDLRLNAESAKAYYKVLRDLKKTLKLREQVKMEHLLHFSEIFEQGEEEGADEAEWVMTAEGFGCRHRGPAQHAQAGRE